MSALRKLLHRARWPLLVLAGTLLLTRVVTVPGVQPADAGEFQLVARELGIAHPPGYALYTLAAHGWGQMATRPLVGRMLGADPSLWTRWAGHADPWTWATNAFSALLAALTLAFVYRTGSAVAEARLGGLAAALALLATPTFLAQTAVANIRMPTALFTALLLFLTIRWLRQERARSAAERRSPDWDLAALALVAGLGVGHHGTLAFLAAACAAVILWSCPALLRDWRTLGVVAGALIVAILPLLYLPIRDAQGALFDENRLTTVGGFLKHVTAADFRGDALYFRDLTTALDRAQVVANIFVLQFGVLTLALAAGGLVILLRRDPLPGVLLAAFAGVTTLATMTYRAPQTMEYLLPAYVALALAAGVAVATMARWRPRRVAVGFAVAAAWVLATALIAGQTARAVRAAAPDLGWLPAAFRPVGQGGDPTILASWHYFTPLTYLFRHGQGDGVAGVEYVYPQGAESPGETWLKRMRAISGPVLLTNRPREVQQADIPLWPVSGTPFYATSDQGTAYEPLARHSIDPPAVFGDLLQLDRAVAHMAMDGRRWRAAVSLHALRPIRETLAVTVQLIDPSSGIVWGQTDRAITPGRWGDDGRIVDELVVVPFRGPRPTRLHTNVGIYRYTPGGPERLPVNGGEALTIGRQPDSLYLEPVPLPATPPGQVPFGNAMTLTASSIRRSGDHLIVDLTWRADETAAESDYTVSVQAHGDGWSAQDDGTPALGAIPTLKWLPGMAIHDRHRLPLPADLLADSPFHVTVGVYDAFSLEPLPVTDAERVRAGQGQAAEVYRQR